jgi:hypothetical protein
MLEKHDTWIRPNDEYGHTKNICSTFPFNVEQTGNKKFPMGLLVKKMFIHYQLLDFITSDMKTHKCFKIRFHLGSSSGKRSWLL